MRTESQPSHENGRPLNILTFTSLFPNAVSPTHGVFILQRIANLAQLGHRVTVVAPVPYVPSFLGRWKQTSAIPRQEEIAGLEVHHPRYALIPKVSMPFHGRLIYAGATRLVERLHKERKFDLVDAHYVYPDGFAGVKLAQHLGIPSVVSARGTDINLFPTFRTIRPQIKWTLDQARQVVAVSKGLKQKVVELGIPLEKLRVIGNGIDPAKFRPQDRVESRARLGIPSDAQVAICVAGLVGAKGHSYLLEAAALLAKKLPKLRMYFVGKGVLLQQLREKSLALGIVDRLQFAGSRPHDELQYWFSAADVSCLISLREGCPNVVAESLACGCPVIGSDIPGIKELVCNEQLGILVQRNSSAVAKSLESAFAKKWDRKAISDSMAGKTWTDVARQVETVFLQALTAAPNKVGEGE